MVTTEVADAEMTVQEAFEQLERLAAEYGIEPEVPGIVKLWRPRIEASAINTAIECNRWRRKYERDLDVIAALRTWDEGRERRRVRIAFEWCERETPVGAWAWAMGEWPEWYLEMRDELDASFDLTGLGIERSDPGCLYEGLVRFKAVVADLRGRYYHNVQGAEDRKRFGWQSRAARWPSEQAAASADRAGMQETMTPALASGVEA